MCGSSDSIGSESDEPYAPEAGQWFDYQIKQLAENAKMTRNTTTTTAPDLALL